MKTSLLALLLLSSPFASANGLDLRGAPEPELYECRLLLVASDVKQGGDWSFTAGKTSDGHGGEASVYAQGEHELTIVANKQWLGISWKRKGVKIAESVFVLGSTDKTKNRVAVVYDPSDSGDQISLGCDLVSAR